MGDGTLLSRCPGDGLRHFAYQKEQKFYNGVTLNDIHGENSTNINGIQGMHWLVGIFPFISIDRSVQHGPKKALSAEGSS